MITAKLGINLASISAIIALGHMVSSLIQPLFGFFADKLRHRVFMFWGLILSALFIPLTPKTTTIITFLACLFLGMIGNALFHPQVSALVKVFNKYSLNLSRDMGIFLGLGTIGYAIGPYLSTYCAKNFTIEKFYYFTIYGIVCAVLIYFLTPKIPAKEEKETAKENFFVVLKDILKDRKLIYLAFLSVIKSALSISFGVYIPFLLNGAGFSLEKIGLITTLFFVSGGFGTMFSSKLEKIIGPNGVITLSFMSILPLVLLFLYCFKFNKYLSCAIFILCGFFILLSVGVIMVQAQNSQTKHLGLISGVMQGFSWGLGSFFLAPLGFIAQKSSIEVIFILMGTIAFLVGLMSMKYKKLS